MISGDGEPVWFIPVSPRRGPTTGAENAESYGIVPKRAAHWGGTTAFLGVKLALEPFLVVFEIIEIGFSMGSSNEPTIPIGAIFQNRIAGVTCYG